MNDLIMNGAILLTGVFIGYNYQSQIKQIVSQQPTQQQYQAVIQDDEENAIPLVNKKSSQNNNTQQIKEYQKEIDKLMQTVEELERSNKKQNAELNYLKKKSEKNTQQQKVEEDDEVDKEIDDLLKDTQVNQEIDPGKYYIKQHNIIYQLIDELSRQVEMEIS